MQAVIMAGGEGSRLRPLTCDLPKPMARLCGRPILDYILDLLRDNGCQKAHITLKYLPQVITAYYKDFSDQQLSLRFVEEDKPLGTAGSVRAAAMGEIDDDFIVISGDAMCDFDLRAAYNAHKRRGAMVSILVKSVPDPREYGLCDAEKNIIKGFVEKPSYAQAVCDTANTGVYILNPRVLSLIPKDKPFDFAKDLFPVLLKNQIPIYTVEEDGYWCDIGDLNSYMQCQKDMLLGKVRCHIHGMRDERGNLFKDENHSIQSVLPAPCYVGHGVQIGAGCTIEAPCVFDDCVSIADRVKIRGGVLLPGAMVANDCDIKEALLCQGASIKARAQVFENAVVGAQAVVDTQSVIKPGIKIWPNRKSAPGMVVSEHLRTNDLRENLFDEEGIRGQTGVEFTPEYCAKLGAVIASAGKNGKIMLACSEDNAARALKGALAAGALSTGCQVLDLGQTFMAAFRFGMQFGACSLGVYLQGGEEASVTVLEDGALPCTRATERSIEAGLQRSEFTRCRWDRYLESVNMSGVLGMYEQEIIRHAGELGGRFRVQVVSGNNKAGQVLQTVLEKLGCMQGDGLTIHISQSGQRASFESAGQTVEYEKLLLLCLVDEFMHKRDAAAPFWAPPVFDEVARAYGQTLYRYFDCPADHSDAKARDLLRHSPWVNDGIILSVKVLHLLKNQGKTLWQMLKDLPEFAFVREEYAVNAPILKMFARFKEKASPQQGIGEGVWIDDKEKSILVRPFKNGKGLKVFCQAHDMEAAKEFALDIGRQVSENKG